MCISLVIKNDYYIIMTTTTNSTIMFVVIDALCFCFDYIMFVFLKRERLVQSVPMVEIRPDRPDALMKMISCSLYTTGGG